MPLMDEFREERAEMKNKPAREKFAYFWDYYKWYMIGGIIVVAIVASFVHSIVTQKENALYVATLNCGSPDGTDAYTERVADYLGIDTDEYDIVFETYLNYSDEMDDETYTTVQKLSLYVAAAELDGLMAGGAAMENYANSGQLADLRTILTEEQLSACEPYLYYVDQAVIDERAQLSDEGGNTSTISIPDPRSPEQMEDPVPVALYIGESTNFASDVLIFSSDDAEAGIAIGVYQNTERLENVTKYLEYLIEGL